MKITFFETEKWHEDYIRKSLKNTKHELNFYRGQLNEKTWKKAKDSEIVGVFVYSKINENVISKLKKLKGIVTMSTGFDHIDTELCKEKGIKLLNVPSYGKNTVAEYAFGLILSLTRKIHKAYQKTQSGDFSKEGLEGMDLKGKTIGIVGLGDIGKHTAKIANGFGMKILGYDRKKDKNMQKKYGVEYCTMNKLLKNSDIISLHVPYNKSTHHLINKESLKKIKKDALIINTSRGGVIDTNSLLKFLKQNKLGGVALDVLEEEEAMKKEIGSKSADLPKEKLKDILDDHLLLHFDKALVTPHNAFNTKEAIERILEKTASNVKQIAKLKKQN